MGEKRLWAAGMSNLDSNSDFLYIFTIHNINNPLF
jgi:hypothetical protein